MTNANASPLPGSHTPRLQAPRLRKVYSGRCVVQDVSLEVRPGEVVGLLGPNGAGKTTSFYMIVGMVPPDGGTISFRGEDISRLPMYRRARLGMGYLAQEPSIFRRLTVRENVEAILQTLDLTPPQRKERLEELLEELQLTHLADQKALTLSGGERRRLEITRAMATSPDFLMLDEPFGGVDPKNVFGGWASSSPTTMSAKPSPSWTAHILSAPAKSSSPAPGRTWSRTNRRKRSTWDPASTPTTKPHANSPRRTGPPQDGTPPTAPSAKPQQGGADARTSPHW